jgi:hypothetical protein
MKAMIYFFLYFFSGKMSRTMSGNPAFLSNSKLSMERKSECKWVHTFDN